MAGGDIEDVQCLADSRQGLRGMRNRQLDMFFACAYAAPADSIQITTINHAPQDGSAARFIAIHIVECAAGIEAGRQAQAYAFG